MDNLYDVIDNVATQLEETNKVLKEFNLDKGDEEIKESLENVFKHHKQIADKYNNPVHIKEVKATKYALHDMFTTNEKALDKYYDYQDAIRDATQGLCLDTYQKVNYDDYDIGY